MKKLYGTIFKELRLNKGYSIKEISDNEVSSSTISKFEHGTAMISIDKFFRILSNINVSPNEFFLYIEERTEIPYSFSSIVTHFSDFKDKKDIIASERILEKLKKLLIQYPDRKFLRIQIVNIKAVLSQNLPDSKRNIDNKDIQLIKQHLLSTKNWNEFEIRIYCNTIHLFEMESIELLTNTLLSPLNYKIITPKLKWLLSIALVNLTHALLLNNKILSNKGSAYFEKIIRFIDDYPIPDNHTPEKAFLKFNIGSYRYLVGEKERGIQEMKEIIHSFALIGCNEWANQLISKFEKYTDSSYLNC